MYILLFPVDIYTSYTSLPKVSFGTVQSNTLDLIYKYVSLLVMGNVKYSHTNKGSSLDF